MPMPIAPRSPALQFNLPHQIEALPSPSRSATTIHAEVSQQLSPLLPESLFEDDEANTAVFQFDSSYSSGSLSSQTDEPHQQLNSHQDMVAPMVAPFDNKAPTAYLPNHLFDEEDTMGKFATATDKHDTTGQFLEADSAYSSQVSSAASSYTSQPRLRVGRSPKSSHAGGQMGGLDVMQDTPGRPFGMGERRPTNYKTKMCRDGPACKFGRNCWFAHSKEELKGCSDESLPANWKTKMCVNRNNCKFGHFCWFAHSQAELRRPTDPLLHDTAYQAQHAQHKTNMYRQPFQMPGTEGCIPKGRKQNCRRIAA